MVVLDSSFLVAYHNTRDVHHAAAARAMVQLLGGSWGRAVLLEYVFLEVVTVLLSRRGPETAFAVADTLLSAREVAFVPCSDLFLEALALFRGQSHGRLSFVDSAIAVVALRDASPVLTFDADFNSVEGVAVLPSDRL